MAKGKKSITAEQQIRFLRKISFFHDFDDNELRQFLAVSRWLKVPRGAYIIREGTLERGFYILVKGKARVIKEGEGEPVLLTELKDGDCFGEMAMVTEIRRTADVVAATECYVLKVDPAIISESSVFLQLKFYRRFCEILVERLSLANQRVAGGTPGKALSSREKGVKKKEVSGAPAAEPALKVSPRKIPAASWKLPPMPDPEERLSTAKLQARIHPDVVRAVNPRVADLLEQFLRRGEATSHTREFAELISLDPALSCRVIQAANSPLYRRATMVATIPHAMVIIGIEDMRELVREFLAESGDGMLFGGVRPVEERFWRHVVVVGRIAELLKEAIRVSTPTDIYLAGLFHDLGMMALAEISPHFYPQLAQDPSPFPDLLKGEREYIGVDHGKAGKWLGESIGLPQAYLDVMECHHQPHKASSSLLPVALVSLANIFAKERGEGLASVDLGEAVQSFAWVLLQEQHPPFLDVNVVNFIDAFREELDKAWPRITDLP